MSILITGGAGYIGSHTCIELIKAGYDIVVIDNFSNSHPKVFDRIETIGGKKVKYYHGDLLNKDDLEVVFQENDIEAVIHFAGLKAVGESVSVPLYYYQNNVIGTIILCEIMKKYHVKKLIFSSSASVYGFPDEVPIKEDFLLKPISPYGRTKLMIEEILKDIYYSDHEWSIVLLRYFNPIGAHKSGLIGEIIRDKPNNIMPSLTKVAAGKLAEFQVFGNSYPTKDGTGVRDYIHVVDLAVGHVKALEKVLVSTGVHPYNLGTGEGYSVMEIISAFESATGIKIPYKITAPRPGDVAICYADPTKARKELGWKAEKGIEEMCEDAWRWEKKNWVDI